MFKNIFNKKNNNDVVTEDTILKQQIQSWNLTEIRAYIQNRKSDFSVDKQGINAVLKQFITVSKPTEKYPNGKRFIEIDNNDIRIKKAFDIILLLSKNSMLSLASVEKMEKFRELYEDIIIKFDKDNAQTYEHKLKEAVNSAIVLVEAKKGIEHSLDVRLNGA